MINDVSTYKWNNAKTVLDLVKLRNGNYNKPGYQRQDKRFNVLKEIVILIVSCSQEV